MTPPRPHVPSAPVGASLAEDPGQKLPVAADPAVAALDVAAPPARDERLLRFLDAAVELPDLAQRVGASHPGFAMSERELIDWTLTHSNRPGLTQLDAENWIDVQPDFETAHNLKGFGFPDGKFRFRPRWNQIAFRGALSPRWRSTCYRWLGLVLCFLPRWRRCRQARALHQQVQHPRWGPPCLRQ